LTTFGGYGTVVWTTFIALCGCANPGPPLPPTLNLPQVVPANGLTAARVGGEVRLHWTTPSQTTDKLPIKGPIRAEICRDLVVASLAKGGANTKTPCSVAARVPVAAGASDAVDRLPATLTVGPARRLSYRVQLLNRAGRTAGPSAAVSVAAGDAPGPVEGFAGSVTKAGVVLRWRIGAPGPGDTELATAEPGRVELDRIALDPVAAASPERKSGLPGAQKQATETRLRASAGRGDAGGAVDRTAEMGHSYSYTAQRVDAVVLGGQALELRSVPSATLTFTLRDEFPPDVPAGLVAVPGLAGEGGPAKPAVDLSWEPDMEAGVAGYRVYRREVGEDGSGAWKLLDSELVTTSAYRDMTVVAGRRYAYRVTAVSTAGHESGPSGEAVEKAPAGG